MLRLRDKHESTEKCCLFSNSFPVIWSGPTQFAGMKMRGWLTRHLLPVDLPKQVFKPNLSPNAVHLLSGSTYLQKCIRQIHIGAFQSGGCECCFCSGTQCCLLLGNITVVNGSSLSIRLTGYFGLELRSFFTSNKKVSLPCKAYKHFCVTTCTSSSHMPESYLVLIWGNSIWLLTVNSCVRAWEVSLILQKLFYQWFNIV